MSTEYQTQCIMGRQLALAHLQMASKDGDLPLLARQIRKMCEDRTGQSVGYLFQLGEVAIYGLEAGIKDVSDLPSTDFE